MWKSLSILIAVLLAAPYCAIAQEGMPEPGNEQEARNLETMRLWGEEVWGKGRLDLVPELVAPEYTRHGADGTRVVTSESYAKEIEAGRAQGWSFTNHAVTADGDLIWTRWSFNGRGPDGEEVSGKGIQIYRFEDGKLAETWNLVGVPGDPWAN